MDSRKNQVFDPFKNALHWLIHDLVPVMPNARPKGLTIHLEEDGGIYQFASVVMQAFNAGIKSINVDTIPVEEFFGEDDKQQAERISAELLMIFIQHTILLMTIMAVKILWNWPGGWE